MKKNDIYEIVIEDIGNDGEGIGHPINDFLIPAMRAWLQKKQNQSGRFIYDEASHTGLVRHILTRVGFSTGELIVCVVINGKRKQFGGSAVEQEWADCIRKAVEEYNESGQADGKQMVLKSLTLNYNTEKTNRILGERCDTLYGADSITDFIGDIRFKISPLSFYQVNHDKIILGEVLVSPNLNLFKKEKYESIIGYRYS